jgi:hypothetical protein
VVERAIAAMGGWDALRAIREMRARVWIEATDHVIPAVFLFPGKHLSVPPYAYPVATWQYKGQNTFVNQPVKVSLDLAVPIAAYVSRNPAITKDMYYELFDSRWSCVSPQRRQPRVEAEAARWHFLERFFGQGIVLEYLGKEKLKNTLVDVVQVADDVYGYEYQTLFDRGTGLLVATREALTLPEQRWYRDGDRRGRRGGLAPVWITRYDWYRPIQGVLTAHRLERSKIQGYGRERPPSVIVHLRIAYNGQEPDRAVPELEE